MRSFRTSALLLAVLAAGTAGAAAAQSATVGSQLDFGVRMARRGLWQEALFRFQQAQRVGGADAHVLNNIAVAYEALGLFDKAHETYREALGVAPNDGDLRRNYSQFLEFYQGYQREEPGDEESGAEESAPEAESAEGEEGAP